MDKIGGIGINLSLGSSSSHSTQSQQSASARGSTVTAGGNVNIQATGAGQDSNITVQGSSISAGNNASLKADNQIQLLAAQNTDEYTSSNASKSGSVGVGLNFGGSGVGVSVSVSASQGKGNGSGQDISYGNTHLSAGNKLTLESGGDTTLQGAVVSANRVQADIGGNLKIESLQDSSSYQEKNSNSGFSATIPVYGYASASASVNAGGSKIASSYQSVTEQSAIRAGDGGFDINVKGSTELKGGAITSTQAAVDNQANSFSTEKLIASDIQNQADYNASGWGVTVGTGSFGGVPSLSGAGVGAESGSAGSVTRAAITGIAGDTEARTGDAQTGIKPIFDQQQVKNNIDASVTVTQAFGQQASKAVGDYAQSKMTEARGLRAQANDPLLSEDQKAALINQAQSMEDNWGEGGAYRVALHTAIGAATGGVAGAIGAGAASAAAPSINDLQLNIAKSLKDAGASTEVANAAAGLIGTVTAAGIGAAASGGTTAGAATALNADANNRQLHPDERAWAKANAEKFAKFYEEKTGGDTISTEQAYQKLLSGGYAMVDYSAASFPVYPNDLLAQQFIVANTADTGLFSATAAEKANPFLNGNPDGSKTPEQQARYGVKNPSAIAQKAVANATAVASQPCADAYACLDKAEKISTAIKALEDQKILYQDNPSQVALINAQEQVLRNTLTQAELDKAKLAQADQTILTDLLILFGGVEALPSLGKGIVSALTVGKSVATKGGTAATGEKAGANAVNSDGLAYRADLPGHLAGPDGFTKSGQLSGTHNLQNATAALDAQGVTYSMTSTGTPGIAELKYSYTNAAGKPVTGSKTVYDSTVYSDQAMLNMAQAAGQRGYTQYLNNTSQKIFDINEGGVNFRVYINIDPKTGAPFVGNVHPIK